MIARGIGGIARCILRYISECPAPHAHTLTLVEKAAKASSMKANPIVLTADKLREIATRALAG